MSTAHAPMIGRHCPEGPGGRDCHCCGQPRGTARTTKRRAAKRAERQSWKNSVRRGND